MPEISFGGFKRSVTNAVYARIMLERRVIGKLVDEARAKGYKLRVHNGEDWVNNGPVRSKKSVMDAIMQTDEDYLTIYEGKRTSIGTYVDIGRVVLIYGNSGWDVISDYSYQENDKRMQELMEPVDKFIDTIAYY